MSAQTILHPTIESLKEEAEKTLTDNAKKYILKKNFALGEGYCNFKQKDAELLYDMIETDNCEVINILKKEIENELQ